MVGIWQACVELRGGRAGPQAQFIGDPHTIDKGLTTGQQAGALLCRILKQLLSGVRVVAGETEFPPHLRY